MYTSSESVTCACGSAGWRSNERRFWEVFSREMCALPTDPSRRVWPYPCLTSSSSDAFLFARWVHLVFSFMNSSFAYYWNAVSYTLQAIISTPHCMCSSSNVSSGSPQCTAVNNVNTPNGCQLWPGLEEGRSASSPTWWSRPGHTSLFVPNLNITVVILHWFGLEH